MSAQLVHSPRNGPIHIPRRFPYELKLMILDHVFESTFPRGFYSTRFWPLLYNWRVRPVITKSSSLALAVPEALYRKRPVIIELDCTPHWKDEYHFQLAYPKPAINKWVRQLEIHVPLWPVRCVDYAERIARKYTQNLAWLKRLSRGELGFEELNLLKFVFLDVNPRFDDLDRKVVLSHLLPEPISFRAKKLEIVTPNHDCLHHIIYQPAPGEPYGGCLECRVFALIKSRVTIRQD